MSKEADKLKELDPLERIDAIKALQDEYRLKMSELATLHYQSILELKETMSAYALSKKLGITPQAITNLIKRYEKKNNV